MLEKQAGVVAAMPFCDESKVIVWAKPGSLTEEATRGLVELDDELVLRTFAKRGQP